VRAGGPRFHSRFASNSQSSAGQSNKIAAVHNSVLLYRTGR
jgi:hypothetical protein